MRDQLKQVEKSTGKRPKQLAEHPVRPPEETEYLWEWYMQVRTPGEYLTWTEISNWAAMLKLSVSGWEAETLRTLDRVYYKEMGRD